MLIIKKEDKPLFKQISVIYGLRCPIEGQIRYIGKSLSGIGRAFEHFKPSSIKEGKTRKNNWLSVLKQQGLEPTVILLESFQNITNSELYRIEQDYITFYKSYGFLTNLTDGGPGMVGHKYTQESRTKMSVSAKKRPLNQALIDRQKRLYPKCLENERFCKECNQVLPKSNFCRKKGFLCKKHIIKKPYERTSKRIADYNRRCRFLVIMKPLNGTEVWFKGYRNAVEFLGGKANKTGIRLAVKSNKIYYECFWEIICRR